MLAIGPWVSPVFADYNSGMEAYRKAWSAYGAQDYASAEEWGKRAVRADPENAHALALLGDLAYLKDDLAAAKESWERALKGNPALTAIQRQIAQAEMEMKLEAEMEPVAVGSLVVRIPRVIASEAKQLRGQALFLKQPELTGEKVPDPFSHNDVIRVLQEAMAGLEPYFQYRVSRPLAVLIYPREAFYEMNHVPTEVLGLFDGKIRIPASAGMAESMSSPRGGGSESVLWHEYTHAVVHDLTHGRAPRWLHEGLAQEAERLRGQALFLKQPEITGEKVPDPFSHPPLRAVLGISERPGEPVVMPAGLFYAASRSLVRTLLELKGWDRMRRFLAALGGGASVEEALETVYGLDLLTLEKRWREWYHLS